MRRRVCLGFLLLACLLGGLSRWAHQPAAAQDGKGAQWVWYNEGNPLADAPAATRFFRRIFEIKQPVKEASLDITADNAFTVWINGTEVGAGNEWMQIYRFDVKRHLVQGKNVLAIQGRNDGGPAGLFASLSYAAEGLPRATLVTDAAWKAATDAPKGWDKVGFDDAKWEAVKVLGPVGSTGPWQGLAPGGSGKRPGRFTVPEGFRVEKVAQNPNPNDAFSLVNMAFDNQGRLLVSREGGPILLCTEPDKEGVYQNTRPYCTQVKNCQGICWARDALLLVGDGPKGTGLYRCRDTKQADQIEEVTLLHKFKGGMGEHGPHAVVHGPDGFLYLVIGNHAWAEPDKLAANSPLTRWPKGQPGPDQGKPNSTEDVLLPRLNDAGGHAANILAPGGTIWRLDHEGRNVSLVAAGFRNQFDAAFSPSGELFTFDSDMEWDEGLPWYRAVRVCHCTPGADFLWRTGAANTPNYYLDSLPPLYETGRGSPVGVEFYDHVTFPEKYRGAFFMADWSIGVIWAIHLERAGAGYKATAEKFFQGSPTNVTDVAVGPDGALYFTMGGRGSQGGVYRIVYGDKPAPPFDGASDEKETAEKLVRFPQPLSSWSRYTRTNQFNRNALTHEKLAEAFAALATQQNRPIKERLRAIDFLQEVGGTGHVKPLLALVADPQPEIRAQAVLWLGVHGFKEGEQPLVKALTDADPLVRRRACEALIRAGFEPPIRPVRDLLGDKDRFVRTAARLVLQRIDPKKWLVALWNQDNDLIAWEGIIALCKTGKAESYTDKIFEHLHKGPPHDNAEALLHYLRTVQLALFHTKERPSSVRGLALECNELFPHADARVNRELAILLVHFQTAGILDTGVQDKLLMALKASKADRMQQIHYAYCLRLLRNGWTSAQKKGLLTWYDGTVDWRGGASFTGFLANIMRDLAPVFTADDLTRQLADAEQSPLAAALLLRLTPPAQRPVPAALADLYLRLMKAGPRVQTTALKTAIVAVLGESNAPEIQPALKTIADGDPVQRDQVAKGLSRYPTAENYPYLLHGLNSGNKLVLFDVIEALRKTPAKPKADEPAPYRAILLASSKLDEKSRWNAVLLLRHWSNNRQFGADQGEWKKELSAWSKWFNQAFPKEKPLPDVASDQIAESKYKFADLLAYLEKEGKTGDVARGRKAFEKAQCFKCHKFGQEGEGVGPELSAVSKRFKRFDILESIAYPSKAISDQYRSTQFVTTKGQTITGLASAPLGGVITVLLSDGSKTMLKEDEIDQKIASLVSVMPEKLLDALELQEIADLFAFMESEPGK